MHCWEKGLGLDTWWVCDVFKAMKFKNKHQFLFMMPLYIKDWFTIVTRTLKFHAPFDSFQVHAVCTIKIVSEVEGCPKECVM